MTKKIRLADEKEQPSPGQALWVSAYEMVPPHAEHRMTAIRDLIDRENDDAQRAGRTWTARLVLEIQVTHVLIVSATPEMDLAVNHKLAAELRELGVEFVLTVPMSVGDEADAGEA